MITWLKVHDLGVIAEVDLVLDEGLTVITGETGAGKTLIVDALDLLLGGRADPTAVRSGAPETRVEGLFFHDGREVAISRVVPVRGRSRSAVDGSPAPQGVLEELGRDLVDLYGQHAHQSLLRPGEQRRALDRYGGVDLEPVRALRARRAELEARLAPLGGDDHLRARELELFGHELGEIDRLAIASADEDVALAGEQEVLETASALRASATEAHQAIDGGRGALELLAEAVRLLGHHGQLEAFEKRVRALVAELADLASELRQAVEGFEEDPERLTRVIERRGALARIARRHGGTLADVLAARTHLVREIARLEAADETRRELTGEIARLSEELATAESLVGDRRRSAAGPFAREVELHLAELGLPGARLECQLPPTGVADEVVFLLSVNRGEPPAPLAKVASGGELARAMLALRLVLSEGPPTLIFDEVDAGVGGAAALAVGRALRALGEDHQVIVVTHLAQVAAFADSHLVADKSEQSGRTLSTVRPVAGEERIAELARMLSGHPESSSARTHARELLAGVRTGGAQLAGP